MFSWRCMLFLWTYVINSPSSRLILHCANVIFQVPRSCHSNWHLTCAVCARQSDFILNDSIISSIKEVPLVPGSDMAGEVIQIGPEVTKWKVGDKVCPNFTLDHLFGDVNRQILGSALGGGVRSDNSLRERINLESKGRWTASWHNTRWWRKRYLLTVIGLELCHLITRVG